MNGRATMNHPSRRFKNPAQWLRLGGLLCLMLALPARATDAIYQNFSVLNYNVPGNPPPQIDARAFDNENQFTINFSTLTVNPQYYETANTINYTNYGLMVANSPLLVNNNLIVNFSLGCGLLFDTLNTSNGFHSMAGTFYNPGTIRVNSAIDSTNSAIFFASGFTLGRFNAWATNIVNPGSVTVGENGLMQFTGNNVDLTRSTLVVEPASDSVVGVPPFLGFGTDNVGEWNPGFDLGPTFALSSFPYQFFLTASTPYINIAANGPSNNIIRAVFIQDDSGSNVTYNVYFDSPSFFGGGNVTVEWVGSYVDYATGNQFKNYLYLNNNYLRGASTNVALTVNNIPDNFTFTESYTPLFQGTAPAAPGFLNIFPVGSITNAYSYATNHIIATSVTTNATLQNPSAALTNLPGRIQINSQGNLNLALAQISGANYFSVQATNQFNGSPGAQITAAFSDFNLGVTNGFLTISNLVQTTFPNWSGTNQAWSTRWINVTTNGITNDFRVMIVGSQLNPRTTAQVQDFLLHGTNLVLSDTMNVMRNLRIDAKAMTLTTNLIAVGATSPQGELNYMGAGTLGTVAQFPNLLWVTNNGAIRAPNLATFGSAATSYGAFVNSGTITNQGSTIYASNFLSGGVISNGVGSFTLQSTATTLTNVVVAAGGNVSITTGTLLATNVALVAGKSLTLSVTNSLIDNGPVATNGNLWVLGSSSIGSGFNLLIKPAVSSLLGTTITNIAPISRNVANGWAASDLGASTSGYSNNAAIGRLILDSFGPSPGAQFTFNGTGVSNAIYVDYLELKDYATNRDVNGNASALAFNNNLVIYYAQAVIGGVSIAEKLNHKNGDHLRWVPAYAGYYSSTSYVNPDGTTNKVNSALAQSTTLDSDGDGIDNAHDATPFFTSGNVNFTSTLTNAPPLQVRLQWQTIPGATNYVLYRTNLLSANWLVLTNFISFTNVPPVGGWPITTNAFDTVSPTVSKFYRVRVDPNSANYNGP
jgi:hypothetical protein